MSETHSAEEVLDNIAEGSEEEFYLDIDTSSSVDHQEQINNQEEEPEEEEVMQVDEGAQEDREQQMIILQNNQRRVLMNRVNDWIHGQRGIFGPAGNVFDTFQDNGSSDSSEDQNNAEEEGRMGGGVNDENRNENTNYDVTLPSSHSYLGQMLECECPRPAHSSSQSAVSAQKAPVTKIPIISIEDFVPVPGQNFALRIQNFRDIALLRRIYRTDHKTLGLLPLKSDEETFEEPQNLPMSPAPDFGCTMEIVRWKEEANEVQIVAIARERFHIIERIPNDNGTLDAIITIVTDNKLPSLSDSVLGSNSNFPAPSEPRIPRNTPRLPNSRTKSSPHRPQESQIGQQRSRMLIRHRMKMRRLHHAAIMTSHSTWVYKMYHTSSLRLQVFEHMSKWWHNCLKPELVPDDATDFSFYVIARLPLSNGVKMKLMKLKSAEHRLRSLCAMLSDWTTLNCSNCGRLVAHRRDVFSMSSEGPMNAYVNPAGVVHETLTLHRAHSLFFTGLPSSVDSWFPGYEWTICHCRGCSRHMGWKFTTGNKNLKPQSFYGLTRSALQSQIDSPVEGATTSSPQEGNRSSVNRIVVI